MADEPIEADKVKAYEANKVKADEVNKAIVSDAAIKASVAPKRPMGSTILLWLTKPLISLRPLMRPTKLMRPIRSV